MVKKLLLEIDIHYQLESRDALVGQVQEFLTSTFSGTNSCSIRVRAIDGSSKASLNAEFSRLLGDNRYQIDQWTFHVSSKQGIHHDFVHRCLRSIVENVDEEKFNLPKLADLLNLSKPTFYRKIKTITGLSPKEFITGVKMQIAYQLLQTRMYTVSEVSWKCGFSNARHFSKKFMETFKLYPSQLLIKSSTPGKQI